MVLKIGLKSAKGCHQNMGLTIVVANNVDKGTMLDDKDGIITLIQI